MATRRKKKSHVIDYQLRISVRGSEPEIWRRLSLPADGDLFLLHLAIQTAFAWQNQHLFQFYKDELWGGQVLYPIPDEDGELPKPNREGCAPPPNLADVLTVGESIYYVYDFGDSWELEILCEALMIRPLEMRPMVSFAGENRAPFEDCGGIDAYNRIVEVLADRDNPDNAEELAELVEFYGKRILKYDSTDFDVKNKKSFKPW